jgi:citrate lyase subunit beta/citryl-CoA lyase
MTDVSPRRSALYVPGANARAMDKAAGIAADALILDLEDSVAPEAKDAAREAVATAVASRRYGRREVVVRINGIDTAWAEADFAAVAALLPDAVLVPKVDSATDIARVNSALSKAGGRGLPVWAMIETPAAVLNAAEIADAPGVACLVAGMNDLASALHARIQPGRAGLVPHLARIVLAARAHGRAALDGTFNDIRDAAGFRAECVEGRDMGFDGKTLIHPKQIAVANEVFSPSPDEVERARRVIAAHVEALGAGRGLAVLDGQLVENLHAEEARRVIALAEAIASGA